MGNLSNHKFGDALPESQKFLFEKTYALVIMSIGVVEKPLVLGLFKNVQMQGAQKTEPRSV
jgi:hypothetical protein